MKETFILYTEYGKHLSLLNMEQRGILFTAIINFQIGEELPEMDGMTQIAFSFIKSDLERTEENYQKKVETNRENGKRGGRPKKEAETQKPNGFKEKPKKPNGYFENPNDNDNESDNDIITDGLNAGVREEDETDDAQECVSDYLEFMREHPDIVSDITNPDLITLVDFNILSERIAESNFLQSRCSLSWLIGNYVKIKSGAYKDFDRHNRGSPFSDSQMDFILQQYREAKERDDDRAKRLAADS